MLVDFFFHSSNSTNHHNNNEHLLYSLFIENCVQCHFLSNIFLRVHLKLLSPFPAYQIVFVLVKDECVPISVFINKKTSWWTTSTSMDLFAVHLLYLYVALIKGFNGQLKTDSSKDGMSITELIGFYHAACLNPWFPNSKAE